MPDKEIFTFYDSKHNNVIRVHCADDEAQARQDVKETLMGTWFDKSISDDDLWHCVIPTRVMDMY